MFAQVVVYQEPRDDTTPKHMVFVVGQSVVYPNMFDVNGLIVYTVSLVDKYGSDIAIHHLYMYIDDFPIKPRFFNLMGFSAATVD